MGVAVLVLEKEAVVFLFAEIAFQNSSNKVDKCMDILLGEALTQKVSKFFSACKLKKAGE
jgi:hypothetical protein